MNLVSKSVIKWNSLGDMNNESIVQSRQEKLQEMIDAQKTDGVVTKDETDVTGTINFIDNASAQEWITFLTSLAENNGAKIISSKILPV
jgi:hypothetical protein